MTSEALPGVSLTFAPPGSDEEPLRTDVAAILGRFTRGPVDAPGRVESWNAVVGTSGPPQGVFAAPYALRGFFENGGRTAWVLRVCGPAKTASATWTVGDRGGFPHARYQVVATSPGAWANGGRVAIRFQSSSVAGTPTVSVRVRVPGEPPETFTGLPPAEVADLVAAARLVRLVPDGPVFGSQWEGPISRSWDLTLTGGADAVPGPREYLDAVRAQADLPEPALVALPDLGTDLTGTAHVD